jgi:hypothetical protein
MGSLVIGTGLTGLDLLHAAADTAEWGKTPTGVVGDALTGLSARPFGMAGKVNIAVTAISLGFDIRDMNNNGITWDNGLQTGRDIMSLFPPFAAANAVGSLIAAIYEGEMADASRIAELIRDFNDCATVQTAMDRVTSLLRDALTEARTHLRGMRSLDYIYNGGLEPRYFDED